MTQLVREMAAIVPEPETAYWFDLGTIPGRIEAQRVYWDDIRHMPYPRTIVVFITDKGSKAACWIQASEHSLSMAYLMVDPGKAPRFSIPIVITEVDGELRYEAKGGDGKAAAGVLCAIAKRLQTASAAYRPESIGTPAQQRKRAAKGKRPLFAWHTVTIGATPKVAIATSDVAGTHASPRAHDRRGHWRTYPSGKRGWVKHCRVGNPADGVVFKDYRIRSEK